MAAAFQKIAFGHVEAGLRTDNKFDPFPEELNRRLTTQITDLHFAPTRSPSENLKREGIKDEAIYLTGNTVIDALLQVSNKRDLSTERAAHHPRYHPPPRKPWANRSKTSRAPCTTFSKNSRTPRLSCPMHKNPAVREVLQRVLGNHPRPTHRAARLSAVRASHECAHLILTDSGGVQEEAPSLGIPVLVLRRTTERPEGSRRAPLN